MKFIKAAGVFLSAAVLLSAAGCGKSESENSNSVIFYDSDNQYEPQTPVVQNRTPGDETKAQPGTAVSIADLEVTLDSTQVYDTAKQDSMHISDADFIACRFTIKNSSQEAYTVSALSDFQMILGDETCALNISAFALMSTDKINGYTNIEEEIPAGESLTGHVVFEIPSGWESFGLTFTPHAGNDNNDYLSYELTKDMLS